MISRHSKNATIILPEAKERFFSTLCRALKTQGFNETDIGKIAVVAEQIISTRKASLEFAIMNNPIEGTDEIRTVGVLFGMIDGGYRSLPTNQFKPLVTVTIDCATGQTIQTKYKVTSTNTLIATVKGSKGFIVSTFDLTGEPDAPQLTKRELKAIRTKAALEAKQKIEEQKAKLAEPVIGELSDEVKAGKQIPTPTGKNQPFFKEDEFTLPYIDEAPFIPKERGCTETFTPIDDPAYIKTGDQK